VPFLPLLILDVNSSTRCSGSWAITIPFMYKVKD
jgi:hypothetical protein